MRNASPIFFVLARLTSLSNPFDNHPSPFYATLNNVMPPRGSQHPCYAET